MAEIHEVFSVSKTEDDALIVDLDFTGFVDQRDRVLYVLRDGDEFGSAPMIRQWIADNNPEILPYIPPPELTPEELRVLMPRKSMVDFRASLRSIKVVPREGEAELDGIYEEDILAKIALIADKALQAEARDYFLYAEYIERTNPWVDILGGMFGLSPDAIDTEWMR